MSIQELLAIVDAPPHPTEGGDTAMASIIEEKLGISLPMDYIEFGVRYGTGTFFDGHVRITIFNPFSQRYIEDVTLHCLILKQLNERSDEPIPYDLFPQVPGLLPWGLDDNGWTLYWLTHDSSDKWSVLIKPPREHTYFERIDLSMTSFLAAAFSRKMRFSIWRNRVFFSRPKQLKFFPGDG